jgi:hypothetical protein
MAYAETTLPSILRHHIMGFCNTKEEGSLLPVDISSRPALVIHRVQTVSKLRSFLYVWPPFFCFIVGMYLLRNYTPREQRVF